MAILHVDPNAPWYVKSAAETILMLHIGGGGTGLVSGVVALAAKKGARLHRIAGNVFFVAMMVMAAIGATVSPFLPKPDRVSTVAGTLTLYLLATAWVTVRREEGKIGRFESVAAIVPFAAVVAGLAFILMARNDPTDTIDGEPPEAFVLFVVVGAIAALSDVKVIWRNGIAGVQRLARHLWRMCTALFVASGSLFLGQPKVFPAFIRHSWVMFVPALAPLPILVFWMIRVRLTRSYASAANGISAVAPQQGPYAMRRAAANKPS